MTQLLFCRTSEKGRLIIYSPQLRIRTQLHQGHDGGWAAEHRGNVQRGAGRACPEGPLGWHRGPDVDACPVRSKQTDGDGVVVTAHMCAGAAETSVAGD